MLSLSVWLTIYSFELLSLNIGKMYSVFTIVCIVNYFPWKKIKKYLPYKVKLFYKPTLQN